MWWVRVCAAFCCVIFTGLPAAALAMSVTFLNPGKSDEIYWVTAANSMAAAAKSLDIKLEVLYAERDHLKPLEFARQIAARPAATRPNYVVLTNDYGTGPEVLRILDAANIGVTYLGPAKRHPNHQYCQHGVDLNDYCAKCGLPDPQ